MQYQKKATSIDQFTMPNLVYMECFIQNLLQTSKNTANVTPWHTHVHFFVKTGKFGVLSVNKFATDSHETLLIY